MLRVQSTTCVIEVCETRLQLSTIHVAELIVYYYHQEIICSIDHFPQQVLNIFNIHEGIIKRLSSSKMISYFVPFYTVLYY